MTTEEFLKKFQEVLQKDDPLTADLHLLDVDEWDSLAMISTVAFLDKDFGIKTTISEMQDLDTVQDVMNKAGL